MTLIIFIVSVLLMMSTGMSFVSAALTAIIGILAGYTLYLMVK